MITIASESNYAHSLTFDSIEAVEAEAADRSRYASRADYPSDIAYIANLLDLPESHVRVEEVVTLTRSQLRKLEADMSRLVSEVFIDTRWTPPTPPLAVGDVIETEEDLERLPEGTLLFSNRLHAYWMEKEGHFVAIGSDRWLVADEAVSYGPFTIRWLPEPEATK